MKSTSDPSPSPAPVIPQRAGATTIVLVGFMGAGKTSVGRALAQRLGWTFDDLDDHIEAREHCKIEEIFQDSGEAGFRRAESAALRDLLSEPAPVPRVLALGGGAFVQTENAKLLEEAGVSTVFLDGSPAELQRRCKHEARARPLQGDGKNFQELYELRRASYLKATWRVDTNNKDVETVTAEVACIFGLK